MAAAVGASAAVNAMSIANSGAHEPVPLWFSVSLAGVVAIFAVWLVMAWYRERRS